MENIILGAFGLLLSAAFFAVWYYAVRSRPMNGDEKVWGHGLLWVAVLGVIGGVAFILIGISEI